MGGLPPNGKPGGTMNYESSKHMAEGFPKGSLPSKGFQYQADAWKKYDDAQATKKTSGEAKVRKEELKNTPDKKSSRSKKFNTPISSAGSAKKSKGGRVAALLKTKDVPKKEDKLG